MQVDVKKIKGVMTTDSNDSCIKTKPSLASYAARQAVRMSRVIVLAMIGLLVAGCATTDSTSNKVSMTQAETSEAVPDTEASYDIHACDNLPIVTVEDHYDSGQLSLQQEVVIGKDGEQIPHGLMTHYWQNGKKKLQIEYLCGHKHGLRASWRQDGQPWSVGEHRYGKDHGEWIVWYASGQKQQQFTIDNGTWNGTYTSWHMNGQTKMNVEYVDGQRQGSLRLWDDQANLAREIQYADDKVQPSPR